MPHQSTMPEKMAAPVPARGSGVHLFRVFATLALLGFLGLALWANLDASEGRHMLFMDELISHDGVEQIRAADGFLDGLREAVMNDQRYGRTMHYLSFAASGIGEALAGEQGRIVANRMAFALVLGGAIWLLSLTFLKTPLARMLGLVAGLAVPFSSYYATMPKPDPLMIAFLAIYLWTWKRNGHGLGISLVWLGLAFGAKIAAIPAVVVLVTLSWLQIWLEGRTLTRAETRKGYLAFGIGWLVSVPAVVVSFPNGFITYIGSTWLNRGHETDVDSISLLDWLALLQDTAFFGPGPLTFLVIGAFAALVLAAGWIAGGRPGWRTASRVHAARLARSEMFLPVAGALSGAALLGSIMVSTDRLWQFYLFPGTLLVTFGALAALEYIVRNSEALQRPVRVSLAALGALGFVASTAAGAGHTIADFEKLATRSQTAEFQRQESIYTAITTLAETNKTHERRLRVAYNSVFWHPGDSESVDYRVFYTAFLEWHREFDFVALAPRDVDAAAAPTGHLTLPGKIEAFRLLSRHTDHDGPCTLAPCYRGIETAQEGLYLFQRDPAADPSANAEGARHRLPTDAQSNG